MAHALRAVYEAVRLRGCPPGGPLVRPRPDGAEKGVEVLSVLDTFPLSCGNTLKVSCGGTEFKILTENLCFAPGGTQSRLIPGHQQHTTMQSITCCILQKLLGAVARSPVPCTWQDCAPSPMLSLNFAPLCASPAVHHPLAGVPQRERAHPQPQQQLLLRDPGGCAGGGHCGPGGRGCTGGGHEQGSPLPSCCKPWPCAGRLLHQKRQALLPRYTLSAPGPQTPLGPDLKVSSKGNFSLRIFMELGPSRVTSLPLCLVSDPWQLCF